MADDLERRVNQFNTMSLPGQTLGMHVGTANLINDLWRALNHKHEFVSSLDDPEPVCIDCGQNYQDQRIRITDIPTGGILLDRHLSEIKMVIYESSPLTTSGPT